MRKRAAEAKKTNVYILHTHNKNQTKQTERNKKKN